MKIWTLSVAFQKNEEFKPFSSILLEILGSKDGMTFVMFLCFDCLNEKLSISKLKASKNVEFDWQWKRFREISENETVKLVFFSMKFCIPV